MLHTLRYVVMSKQGACVKCKKPYLKVSMKSGPGLCMSCRIERSDDKPSTSVNKRVVSSLDEMNKLQILTLLETLVNRVEYLENFINDEWLENKVDELLFESNSRVTKLVNANTRSMLKSKIAALRKKMDKTYKIQKDHAYWTKMVKKIMKDIEEEE